MKQKSLLLLISLFMSVLFISCGEKTKEEKFLSDLEGLIEKAEAIKTQDDIKAFQQLDELFEQKARDLYGVESLNDIEGSGLSFTDEQKERFYTLVERGKTAVLKAKKRGDSGESSNEYEDNSSNDSLEDDKNVSELNSVDVDEMLDSYEEYVDEYISYYKKASSGDMSALSEYPHMMEKAEILSKKIDSCEDNMSPSQLARYQKISMRMLEEAQKLH